MMKIPHFIHERTYENELKEMLIYHKSCNNCSCQMEGKIKCNRKICPYINRRIETQSISIIELISPIMFETKNKTLVRRTKGIYQNIKEGNISTMFISKIHQDIFEKQIKLYQKQGHMLSNRFAAALFLLTADKFLWNKSKYHIKPNQIIFSEIDIKGIEPNAYVLFKYAKDLTFKTTKVSASELADRIITKESIFKVIMGSMIISRYGIASAKLDLMPE